MFVFDTILDEKNYNLFFNLIFNLGNCKLVLVSIKVSRKKDLENCDLPQREKELTVQEQKRIDSKQIIIVVIHSHF